MSQFVESPCRTFQSGAVIDSPCLRVVLSDGQLALAGLGDVELGTLERPVFDIGDWVSVRLRSAQGTCKMQAAKAFAIGAIVYTAAGGQISDVQGTGASLIGTSLEAATAQNDVVEVLRQNVGPATSLAAGEVTTADLAAGAATMPKVDFSALVPKVAAGVAAAGAVTVAGTTVGQRVILILGTLTAGGPLVAKLPGTDFEAAVSVAGEIQQLTATDLHLYTFVFLLAPAAA